MTSSSSSTRNPPAPAYVNPYDYMPAIDPRTREPPRTPEPGTWAWWRQKEKDDAEQARIPWIAVGSLAGLGALAAASYGIHKALTAYRMRRQVQQLGQTAAFTKWAGLPTVSEALGMPGTDPALHNTSLMWARPLEPPPMVRPPALPLP